MEATISRPRGEGQYAECLGAVYFRGHDAECVFPRKLEPKQQCVQNCGGTRYQPPAGVAPAKYVVNPEDGAINVSHFELCGAHPACDGFDDKEAKCCPTGFHEFDAKKCCTDFDEYMSLVCAGPYERCSGVHLHNGEAWRNCCMADLECSSVEGLDDKLCIPYQLEHPGAECMEQCHRELGECEWCGRDSACCWQGSAENPMECQGATFLAGHGPECVLQPSFGAANPHAEKECLRPCGGLAGRCQWCGEARD